MKRATHCTIHLNSPFVLCGNLGAMLAIDPIAIFFFIRPYNKAEICSDWWVIVQP